MLWKFLRGCIFPPRGGSYSPEGEMEAELGAGTESAARMARSIDRSQLVHRWALAVCTAILIAVALNLFIHGYSYYRLPVTERFRSPLHAELKPGGNTGRMLGIAGSCMMITLLGYSLRKRLRFMSGWGKLKTWLQVHIFLGVAGPILITFHTAFKLRGIVAISYWSMVVVALSGAIGRYLYAQIPRAISGAELEVKDISAQLEEINNRISEWLTPAQVQQLQRITDFRNTANQSGILAILAMLHDDLRWLFVKHKLVGFARSAPALTHTQRLLLPELARQRALTARRITFLKVSHNLFKYWHIFHLPLAQTMYLTMIIHVGVAIMTGYFWRTS